jgi:sarcosine oxidase
LNPATSADVIVIGLGAMGSAALYQLARRGVRAIGIDRFTPPHREGSSHGDTRITRCGVGEGTVYGPLVARSHAIWRELEAKTGLELLLQCGFLAIDATSGSGQFHGKPGFLDTTIASARAGGVAFSQPSVAEARTRWPQLNLAGSEQLYHEPGGGLVFPERCIAAQLQQAGALGATIRTGETVTAIRPDGAGVAVVTDQGVYRAARVILSAGGWMPGLAGAALPTLRLLRQVLHWYAADEPAAYGADRFPSFIWQHGMGAEDSFYGIPIVSGLAASGLKIAGEQYRTVSPTPEAIDKTVGAAEAATLHRDHVAGRLRGVTATALRSAVCHYTAAVDGDFIIDTDPADERVLLVSACSGHGFKHSAGIGAHVAEVLAEGAALLPAFRTARSEPAPIPPAASFQGS